MSVGFIEDKEQLDYINKKLSGDNVLLGAAGTGKTNIAMSILIKAAQMDIDDILFLSYNKTLISFCDKYKLEELARSTHLFAAPAITISTFHSLFSKIFRSIAARSPKIYDHDKSKTYYRKNLIRLAIDYCKLRYHSETTEFEKSEYAFSAEIKFIEDRGFTEYSEYEQAVRIGQGNKLAKENRKYYWAVYKEYLTLLCENGFDCDYDNAGTLLLDLISKHQDVKKYQFIIVDEAQDFSPTTIRAIRSLLSENGVFLYVGDSTQEIYGTRLSWKSLGLNIRNKIKRLENNYRNTIEIGSFAKDILTSKLWQSDAEEILYPKNMVRHGTLPILVDFENKYVQNYFLDNLLQQFHDETTCILTFHKAEAAAIAQYLNDRNISTIFLKDAVHSNTDANCFTCTYHSIKGLDFDNVILTGFDDTFIDSIDYVSDEAEKLSLALRLFYVACTRAKKRLIISSCGKVSDIFPAESTYYRQLKPYELINACVDTTESAAASEDIITALTNHILLKKRELITYFDKSIANAKTELDIQSPWMTSRVVDYMFIDKIRQLLDRKVIVKILYGIQDDKHTLPKNKETTKVVSSLRREFGHDPNFRLQKGNSHGKKIICDLDYAISGSYNWLSYTGISDREEEGTIITDKSEIARIREEYFNF